MPIHSTTPKGAEMQFFNERLQRWRQAILENLVYVGEQMLSIARNNHKYLDQTGNLTSSIGYAVIENGKVYKQSTFAQVKGGSKGATEGREFLQRLISENPSGIVLIMVAGMEYAVYVEAMSLDVLDSAEQAAKRLVPQIVKQLKL